MDAQGRSLFLLSSLARCPLFLRDLLHFSPQATLLALYFNFAVGVVRTLCGLFPTEKAIFMAAMATELVEGAACIHCALADSPHPSILAKDKPLTAELIPGLPIVVVYFVAMLLSFPSKAKSS